jgi:hypothetical protein
MRKKVLLRLEKKYSCEKNDNKISLTVVEQRYLLKRF